MLHLKKIINITMGLFILLSQVVVASGFSTDDLDANEYMRHIPYNALLGYWETMYITRQSVSSDFRVFKNKIGYLDYYSNKSVPLRYYEKNANKNKKREDLKAMKDAQLYFKTKPKRINDLNAFLDKLYNDYSPSGKDKYFKFRIFRGTEQTPHSSFIVELDMEKIKKYSTSIRTQFYGRLPTHAVLHYNCNYDEHRPWQELRVMFYKVFYPNLERFPNSKTKYRRTDSISKQYFRKEKCIPFLK